MSRYNLVGHASGWTVEALPDGTYRWAAHGTNGTINGSAPTRAAAERAARQAEQDLIRHRGEPRVAVAASPMYEQFAHAYAAHAAMAPYNALYDRPAVLSLVGDVAGRTVLDAGCGAGLHAEALQQRGAHVIGFDQSPTLIEVARQRVTGTADLRVHDLAEPWHWITDDSIDVAVLALVLHHIDDRPAVLRELVRVLRRSGLAVVSTTHPMSDWLRGGGSYFDVETVDESLSPHHDWPVRAWRRPLTDVCQEFTDAGLLIETLCEPRPVQQMADSHPDDFARLQHAPAFIAFRLRPRPAAW